MSMQSSRFRKTYHSEDVPTDDSTGVLNDLLFILVIGQMFVLSYFANQEVSKRIHLPKAPVLDGHAGEVALSDYPIVKVLENDSFQLKLVGSEFADLGRDEVLEKLESSMMATREKMVIYQVSEHVSHGLAEELELDIRGRGITVLKQHEKKSDEAEADR